MLAKSHLKLAFGLAATALLALIGGTYALIRSNFTGSLALMATGAIGAGIASLACFFLIYFIVISGRQAWQQQAEFLADLAHELRTPLTIIQTNLDIILDSPAERVASQQHWLGNIQEQIAALTMHANSLRLLAQAGLTTFQLNKEFFPCNEFIRQIANAFAPLAAAKGISLEITAASDVCGYGDELRLKQALGILLDNAIRHTPPGGKIAIAVEQTPTAIHIAVTDSGEGISCHDLPKIFERRYQAGSGHPGSAGLGLAVARQIITGHGGTIHVASTPGEKTVFTIAIPMAMSS